MFYGRGIELEELERRYCQPGFQFPVIYGRRRVGKTRLIQEFLKGKKAIYFVATEQTGDVLLGMASAAVLMQYPSAYVQKFDSWDMLFSYISGISKSERVVFVIDEYPYLARSCPAISSIIQKFIDQSWKETQLYLILCGSSMSFMEHQILGYESPLYGRRTAQLKLNPLRYSDAVRFFPSWSDEEKLYAYGICGGVPQYLRLVSQYGCLRDAVIGEFLTLTGQLREEPSNLMKQELRDPVLYNDILTAIANGTTQPSQIAGKVGKAQTDLSPYLRNLDSLGLVGRHRPVGGDGSRRPVYAIEDNLFRFWYRFMPSCLSLAGMGLSERAYDEFVLPFLPVFFGHVFEDICMQFMQARMRDGHIKELYTDFGHWWGTDPVERKEVEVDLVMAASDSVIAGECKWTSGKAGIAEFERLQRNASLFARGRKIEYVMFSRSGFTEALMDKQDEGLVELHGIKSLMNQESLCIKSLMHQESL